MAEFDPSDNIGTIPVQEKHQFDLQNLQDFMESSVVGFKGTLTVEEFAGGQSNPTYLLSASGQWLDLLPWLTLASGHADFVPDDECGTRGHR